MTTLLADLPNGTHALVNQIVAKGLDLDDGHRRRLGELGFLPGEPVEVVVRGPGGREPLAVRVAGTMFALRLAEARCIEVNLAPLAQAATDAAAGAHWPATGPAR